MVMYGALLLLFLFKIVVGDDIELPLIPSMQCVPTSTQMGNCHVCVCKSDGVYHCRDAVCGLLKNFTDPIKKECDPLYMYRYDTIFCSCDASGYWRSLECKQRYSQMLPKENSYTVHIGTNIPCTPGHFYITDCNICTCDASGYIHLDSCTNRRCQKKSKADTCNPGDILRTTKELCACSDINYFIDRLCIKVEDKAVQEVKAEDLNRIIDFGRFWENLKTKCNPLNTYKLDCSECYCGGNGEKLNCDVTECKDSSQLRNKGSALRLNVKQETKHFESLPELKSQYEKCKPGIKYRYNCNSCFCTDDRLPICTTMICVDEIQLTIHDLRHMSSFKRNSDTDH